jgi:hypothetical protein
MASVTRICQVPAIMARMDDLLRFLHAHLDEDARAAKLMAEFYPARILAEVDAKRQLLKLHRNESGYCAVCAHPEDFDEDADGNREWIRTAIVWPCPTVRLLTLPYADHPEYRPEWSPDPA